MSSTSQLLAVAKAEDAYNLLHHIAWEETIKPRLAKEQASLASLLVSEALGTPLPSPLTREKVAGMCYGINFISSLFEKILREGELAVKDLHKHGITISKETT